MRRCAALFVLFTAGAAFADPPQTVAERSDYKATSRYAEVVDFCKALARESPLVRVGELGTSHEGRALPLLIVADPPISTPEEAVRSRKLVVFAMGNIHAGEVDGKEALLMLARELATARERPLLKDLILVFAPIFNADGNEKVGRNRSTQAGPDEVGVRTNAQGLDLNRDFIKLESPEVRALVRFLSRWDPAVVIDCHTTNGSHHRYTLTYEGGRCPAGDPRVVTHVRDELLPDAGQRLLKSTNFRSFFYGNFSADRSTWETVAPTPRYGTHYVGLRNRVAVLSESYTYASFKDRVLASKEFVRAVCEHTAENKDKLRKLLTDARDAVTKAGRQPTAKDEVVLRDKAVAHGRPVSILGFVEEKKDGRSVPTDQAKDYEVTYLGRAEPTLSVRLPYAYLFPASLTKVVENLQRHGVEVEELREDIELDVEVYRVEKLTRATEFQKHQSVTLDVKPRAEARRIEAGCIVVRTAQPLGNLAAYLLEPQSADGLVTWNFFDAVIAEGKDFPVVRMPAPTPLTSARVRPLPEDRVMNKPITFDTLFGSGRPPNFSGSPVGGLTWLDDGEHFLQTKEGKLRKVHALTGRSEPYADLDKLTAAARPSGGPPRRLSAPRMNPARTAVLLERENDLYHANLDGTAEVRLTKTPEKEELPTFSPDGKHVAFVRAGNLYAVDVATQTERALTKDGGGLISNAWADWVYYEEVFYRKRQAYWWAPDSSRIAFLRFDDTPVRKYTLADPVPTRQTLETTTYPKAGDPNPIVKLGIVDVAGGPARFANLSKYPEASTLVIRAGWFPQDGGVWFYAQDRAQTWLDVCTVPRDGGEPTLLFRDTTKAWVEDPGDPTFLKDGSFLLPSERTGWKHLYRFDRDGKLRGALTSGEWEVQKLHQVDEGGGWAYFSGTRDGHLGSNLYRVHLDGSSLERLTAGPGEHRVTLSPKGNLFLDSYSDVQIPTQMRLLKTDGTPLRTIDTNPVWAHEEYVRGRYERVQIPASDGIVLEGSVLWPPNFDAKKSYPVWFMTYGGPHSPTIEDSWGGGRLHDEMLAQMGYVVFRCDPRSASGKGAISTWTAHRQLGVQELKDVETAIRWLTKQPGIDAARVGMSGHSYGGFLTAFALTHSKLFAAGVAGAPVTDWRNYDSIYTERYMNTPQANPDGYRASSVVAAASNLHGRLLLVHGLMDDNVHAQNSLQLVDALQRANRDFEVMFYPRNRHGVGGLHYERTVLDFMQRTLRPGQ